MMIEYGPVAHGDSNALTRKTDPGDRSEPFLDHRALLSRMSRIRHKILILSGRGGVGKSTVAVNLAAALAATGRRVGLLDVGVRTMAGPGSDMPARPWTDDSGLSGSDDFLYSVTLDYPGSMSNVMSIGFRLQERGDTDIWRGPLRYRVIREFLKDVEWGELDYLVIDLPPETGDDSPAVAQLIERPDGVVVVTTPQLAAAPDIRRCIGFCRQTGLRILGLVENMSGIVCPRCGEVVTIANSDKARALAATMDVPYLGAIPLAPEIMASEDDGGPVVRTCPQSETAKAFDRVARALLDGEQAAAERSGDAAAKPPMTIAVPVSDGLLSAHFGHCERFVFFDVAANGMDVENRRELTPPPHQPGAFPRWLREQGATVVITRGIGPRAQGLFDQSGIQVVVGAVAGEPAIVVREFLAGRLAAGPNACNHGEKASSCHHP